MYTGEVALNEDQLDSLLEAAETLKIKGIITNPINTLKFWNNSLSNNITGLTLKGNDRNQTAGVELPSLAPDAIGPILEAVESGPPMMEGNPVILRFKNLILLSWFSS